MSQTAAKAGVVPENVTGNWKAFSRTARAITGDIKLTSSSITFENGERLPLAYSGLSRGVSLDRDDPEALVFRIVASRDVHLLGPNTLCGGHRVPTYMAFNERDATTYELMMMGKGETQRVRELYLTVIYGKLEPNPEIDRLRLCASYFFTQEN
jgi:hypothetical protein